MTLPILGKRRAVDVLSNMVISVAMVAGSTVLCARGELSPEGVLAAYTLAGAVGGLPVVIRREDSKDT